MKTSKIATIVYANYEENVDMLNQHFSQKELDTLVKTDKDIIRVDYYINGVFVGNKMYTPKQAIAQVAKMEVTQANLYDDRKMECGPDWLKNKNFNEKIEKQLAQLAAKQAHYLQFITKEAFDDSDLPCMMCCDFEDLVSGIAVHN